MLVLFASAGRSFDERLGTDWADQPASFSVVSPWDTSVNDLAKTGEVDRAARRFRADAQLLAAAESVKATYHRGRVVDGVIGSSNVWNSELDRIEQMHRQYGTSVEDMEMASTAQIASVYRIPFLWHPRRVQQHHERQDVRRQGRQGVPEYVYEVVKAHRLAPGK